MRIGKMRSFAEILRDRGTTLCIAWTFNQLAYAIVYPFIPIYLSNERGIPYSTVGLIFPLMGAMVVFSPMLFGPLTDRFGRRPMMNFGQFARAALFVILAYMTFVDAPFWIFAVVLMLNTAVGVSFQIGADAYLADITDEAERPGYYSKIRIGFNLGWAFGPMIGAFFAQTPFWVFFLVTAALCGVGGVFTQLFCRYPDGFTPPARKNGEYRNAGSVIPIIWEQKQILFMLLGSVMLFSLTSQLYSTLSAHLCTHGFLVADSHIRHAGSLAYHIQISGTFSQVAQLDVTFSHCQQHLGIAHRLVVQCHVAQSLGGHVAGQEVLSQLQS